MLNVDKLVQSAREALGWPYVSPGTNDARGIDCSGLFVKMYLDQHASIYHGSNTIFREYCSETGKLTNAGQLRVGMAVFKCKKWTEEDKGNRWYGTEPGNLSHIGFVAGVEPLEIIHASSAAGKVTIDTKIGNWTYWGRLKNVDYGGGDDGDQPSPEPEPMPKTWATVYSDNRKPVKLREKPSTRCKLYDEVPFGSIVEVVKQDVEWSAVNWRGRKGWYMMTKFLLIDENSVPGIGGADEDLDEDTPPEGVCVVIEGLSMEEAEKIQKFYPQAVLTVG